MRFGAISFIWTESFGTENFDLLPRLKAAGLDGIELGILNPARLPASSIRRELEQQQLACTACCVVPPGASLLSVDKDQRTKAHHHIAACLNAIAESGGTLLCGPLYSPVGYFTGVRRTSDEWKRAVEGWQQLAPIAESVGVEVALEPLNRFETYFLNTAQEAASFCDEVASKQVGLLIDTFHANIEEKSIGTALRQAGKHLKHLHSCENDRGTPGTGNVNWPEFFATVKEFHYDNWMVIESFGFSAGALSSAASIWRDLATTPEAIAFEGVKFLKENLSA